MKLFKSRKPKSRFNLFIRFAAIVIIIILLGKEFGANSNNPTTCLNDPSQSNADSKQTLNLAHWRNNNGACIYFIENHELPIIDIRLVFDAGSARDNQLLGLSSLTNNLLLSGTASLSLNDIAKQFEALGVDLEVDSKKDMALIHLRVLNDDQYLLPAINLLAKVIADANFPEKEITRLKNQTLTALQYETQRPDKIAQQAFYETLYSNHPYATNSLGDKKSIETITRNHIKQFHQQYYVANNLDIAIVGDINKTIARIIVNKLTALLPRGESAIDLPPTEPIQPTTINIEHSSQQTHIYAGNFSLQRGANDYYALYIINHILGGGSNSLLYEKIREDHGLSYSVYSYFVPMRAQGPLIIGLQTRQDQAEQALTLMRRTLMQLIESGPTEEQIASAKRYLIGNFPLKISTNKSKSAYLAAIGFYNLPLDYLDNYTKKLQETTTDQIHAALKKYLNPDEMIVISVGKE